MVIETSFGSCSFTQVPNYVLEDRRLSGDALAALCWLAMHRDGFTVHVGAIRDRFGWGRDKWRRVWRELGPVEGGGVGAITPMKGGFGGGQVMRCKWPDPVEGRKTRPSSKPQKSRAGKPVPRAGKPVPTGPENPSPYKDNTAADALAPKARAASAVESEEFQLVDKSDAKPKQTPDFVAEYLAKNTAHIRRDPLPLQPWPDMAGGEMLRNGASS